MKTARVKKEAPRWDQHGRSLKAINRPIKLADDNMKMEYWQLHQLAKGYHWKTLNNLLLSEPVVRILKPKLIGGIQGPVPPPAVASNILEKKNGIMRLLHDAGFVAGVFVANKMLECNKIRWPTRIDSYTTS